MSSAPAAYYLVPRTLQLCSESCSTVGSSGAPCVFPFIYRGVTYTKVNINAPNEGLRRFHKFNQEKVLLEPYP